MNRTWILRTTVVLVGAVGCAAEPSPPALPEVVGAANPLLAGAAGQSAEGFVASDDDVEAVAGNTNCGSSVGGLDLYTTIRSKSKGGRTVALRSGSCFDESFSEISKGYKSGDRTWVDRRKKGGVATQCGPFNAKHSNEVGHQEGFEVQACADWPTQSGGREHVCTGFVEGHDGDC